MIFCTCKPHFFFTLPCDDQWYISFLFGLQVHVTAVSLVVVKHGAWRSQVHCWWKPSVTIGNQPTLCTGRPHLFFILRNDDQSQLSSFAHSCITFCGKTCSMAISVHCWCQTSITIGNQTTMFTRKPHAHNAVKMSDSKSRKYGIKTRVWFSLLCGKQSSQSWEQQFSCLVSCVNTMITAGIAIKESTDLWIHG